MKSKEVKKHEENFYCDECGGCGIVMCDGIKDFLKVHIEGKTNCKNEASFIVDIIDMMDDDN